MCTRIQLKEFLEEISESAKFVKFDYRSSEKFHVLLKCKIGSTENNNNYVKKWINQFSDFTSTAWIVRGSCPAAKRFLFKKSYACHRSAHNKNKTSPRTRNLDCKAKIIFRIKYANRNTLKNDPYLAEGLNMNISIEFEHTHLVRDRDSFNLLSSSSYSKSVFYEYFDQGYSPVAAKCYHVLRLLDEYGQDSEQLANANLNPKLQHIQYIYKKRWNQKEINMNAIIIEKIETLEKIGHTIRYSENDQFVVIVTPLMKRVISQIGVGRVLVDATLEPGAPCTLFLYVPSMIGSLPVACAIFAEQTEGIYLQMFLTIKLAIESDSVINFAPELLLHDDNSNIKQALITVFPNAIVKLNRYSLCRDLWRLICDETLFNQRPKKVGTHIAGICFIKPFKSLIFAKSLVEARIIRISLRNSTMPDKCYNKLEEIWQNRQQWLDESGLCDGFNDAPISFMKEFILQLCKPFNGILPAMMDVVTNVIESHYHKILRSHRDGDAMSVYTKYIARLRIDTSTDSLRKVGPNEYQIQNGTSKHRFNQVDIDTMCCDCGVGQKGRMCEHLCGILNLNDDTFTLFSSLNYKERDVFLKILGEDTIVKYENEHDLLEIEESATEDERSMSSSSSKRSEENHGLEIKKEERDPLEENHEDVTSVIFASEDTSKEELKEQYEASMKSVNDEFRRLNKLFKENPNRTNLYTMQRLAKELAKIKVVEEVDLSNMFVTLNGTGDI